MEKFDYDLFVIGAGSGGVRAARMAAKVGVRVCVAEDRYLGGTCVNVGCVPKKLYTYAAHFAEDFHDAINYGWQQTAPPQFDWPTLRDNKTSEIKRLNDVYKSLLHNSGATLIEGRATVTGAHTVDVNGASISAERILVATGGWPSIPEFPGSEHVISSNEVFDLDAFPASVVVVGGGYIAVEFAGIFNGLGADTHLFYRGELFLRGFDQDVRTFVAEEMTKKGINLCFNSNIASIDKQVDGRYLLTLQSGETQVTDLVLYATGRAPNTQNLGLEKAGVALDDAGAIIVDDNFQTNISSIYALGDVINRVQLTPVALAEGMALVNHLYGGTAIAMDYTQIPTAVFCQPNIGTVGLTEADARVHYEDVDIYRSSFRALKHTVSGNDERTMMKLVVDRHSDQVLGVHMVGADAGEIIQGIGIALKAGATKSVFDETIGIHPTSAEEFVTMREPIG